MKVALLLFLPFVAACGSDGPVDCCPPAESSGLRIVNAFTAPVDVLIDDEVVIQSLAAGAIDSAAPATGSHILVLRRPSAFVSQSITIAPGALNTIAAVRAPNGAVASAVEPGKAGV